MLEHGGRLLAAARAYGIPAADWLDLSTGVNPHGWPVPVVPAEVWRRLPEDDDELVDAARRYYGVPHILPVAGSQAAIMALPGLHRPGRVGMLQPSYAEHAHAWRRHGHEVLPWTQDRGVAGLDALVLVQPNNPTGAHFTVEQLLRWHAELAARGGWLLIDEAFVDAVPETSVLPHCPRPGLIVLRGLGKFFGLAGARVGFVLAEQALLDALHETLGPWTLPGPSRWIARQALADREWQTAMRGRLHAASARLAELLAAHGLRPDGGTALFQWLATPQAEAIQHALGRRGILIRRFAEPASLRFGLPGAESEWQRLADALAEIAP
jgi:cobalamin biosynthetic protein CobC